MESLEFSIYKIMLPTNSDSSTSSFPILILLFFFSCLLTLAKTSNTMLNKNGHPHLVPDFRGIAFSFSPLSMLLAVGLP